MEPKKTPLYQEHFKLGGKMADFAGWLMPLWYPTGQSAEHHATRKACGLFDICHMGEYSITGKGTLAFFQRMLTNDISKMADGQAMYNFMLNEQGGVVDDCILYRFDVENWMLVVNAGGIGGDFKWLSAHSPSDVHLSDISDETVKIDLQGPAAPKLMSRWIGRETLSGLRFFRFLRGVPVDGMPVLVSRTGYTGEIGFELYTDIRHGTALWNLLLDEGKKYGILPCGLGARDTLRTEAGLPLHGHELTPARPAVGHPWEFAIAFDTDFIGKEALLKTRESGGTLYIVPFILEGKRKAMPGWEVYRDGKKAGTVMSGVISPTLDNTPIGFAECSAAMEEGTALSFRQAGREETFTGKVTKVPFVPLTSRKKMEEFL